MAAKKISWEGFSLKPKKEMPEGLWLRCPGCEHIVYKKTVVENKQVCPECSYHFRVSGKERISLIVDEGAFEEFFPDMTSSDPLDFHFRGTSYKDRTKAEELKTGNKESLLIGKGFVKGRPVIIAAMDFDYLGGSMGAVLGEKFCKAVDIAIQEKVPFIVISSSGGARMHEGVVSLGQMAKTSAALARLDDAGGLFISILTDPTTGGVTASFAMLGDIIIAEPGALIGFAGPRTIYQTIKIELPEGFQRSEFLLEHGFVDMIVHRHNMRSELAKIIDYCE